MKKINVLIHIAIIIIGVITVTACKGPSPSSTDTSNSKEVAAETITPDDGAPEELDQQGAGDEEEIENNSTDAIEADTEPTEFVPEFTPTPDLRLLPEQWQEWPVVPEISPNAVAIYEKGIALGNNPQHLSKIGDCQSIKEVLLGIYDLPTRYSLAAEDQYLQSTIDNFTGSFNRDGMAVRGGFNAATVLSPIWADPEYCEAGENPIQCEYRVNKPVMVIISLEVWWDGRSPERYEQYMRKIIEYSIEQGVVPILSTKADNVEGDHSINYTTAKLAYEYDIPLWNFWLAVQTLPNQGIDPARDGFHISVDAWNVRSYTALKTINAVTAAVITNDSSQTVIVEETEPVASEPVVSSLVFHKDDMPAYDMDGSIYFELTETIDGEVLPAGIYQLTLNAGDLIQIFPAGSVIISENLEQGFIVSVDDAYSLVRPDGSKQNLTGFDFAPNRIIMIGTDEFIAYEKETDYPLAPVYGVIEPSGNVSIAFFDVAVAGEKITNIYTASRDFLVASVGDCDQECDSYTIHNYLIPDEMSFDKFAAIEDPLIHPVTGKMAFWRNLNGTDSLYLIDLANNGDEQYLGLFGNVLLDQEWSHSGESLAAIKMERSEYYGRATDILHYVVDGKNNILKEYPAILGLNPRVAWSPDDQFIITSLSQISEQSQTSIVLRIINTVSGQIALLSTDLGMSSKTYIAIKHIIWFE